MDGLTWTPPDAELGPAAYAYNATLQWDDGTSHHFACRERPHIVQNGKGEVIALTNGAAPIACNNAGQDDYSYTSLQAVAAAASK